MELRSTIPGRPRTPSLQKQSRAMHLRRTERLFPGNGARSLWLPLLGVLARWSNCTPVGDATHSTRIEPDGQGNLEFQPFVVGLPVLGLVARRDVSTYADQLPTWIQGSNSFWHFRNNACSLTNLLPLRMQRRTPAEVHKINIDPKDKGFQYEIMRGPR